MQEILDNAQLFNTTFDSSSQCDDPRLFEARPAWRRNSVTSSAPPSDLLVTHVNQTHQLVSADKLKAAPGEKQSSEEWLETHSLSYLGISLADLLKKGKKVKRKGEEKHLVFKAIDIAETEYKLNEAIEVYHKRIKWLLYGSRKVFGLVKGERVAVLIDSSDDNIGFGRIDHVKQDLLNLIDDQLKDKKSIYLMSFGTNPQPLWDKPRHVNKRTLQEARDFVENLYPMGGCNLMSGVKKVLKLKNIDSVLAIVGTCCDQTTWSFFDFVEQSLICRQLPIQTVAYNTTNSATHSALKRLALITGSRFHCHSNHDKREVYKGFDIQILLRQAQSAVDVMSKIKLMKSGKLGDVLVSIETEVELEVERLAHSRFLPRPVNHHGPLMLDEISKIHPITSKQWLVQHGLKAKNLNVYQVLAPNAFDPVHDFVPVLGKCVASKIHKEAMQQLRWVDGTVKNIHVDVAMLYEYQTLLGAEVKKYEERIEWLSSMSRKIWGTICHKRVVLMIDTSVSNKDYMVHLQHSIRICLEQQIPNKQAFNIIAMGSHPKMWRPSMQQPTPENLQQAWRWSLDLEAGGSRNFLAAFRAAMEGCGGDGGYDGEKCAVYLITSGIPDQEEFAARAYVGEVCCHGNDVSLNTILFTIDTSHVAPDEMPSRYASGEECAAYLRSLCEVGNGRFHWFNERGIVESDDIYLLSCEMEQAVEYSKISASLVQQVRDRDQQRKQLHITMGKDEDAQHTEIIRPFEIIEPRHTILTLARLNLRNEPVSSEAWKVSKRKAQLPKAPYKEKRSSSKPRSVGKVRTEQFYTGETSNAVGHVISHFPAGRSVRKKVPEAIFPQKEEHISSKQWLKKYGLNKMKLNLNKYVGGRSCRHEGSASSKWHTSLFPSSTFRGSVRHVDMRAGELEEYERQVERAIKRYAARLGWLLSASRNIFGTLLESNVVVAIDCSGSMVDFMESLKRDMGLLVWEQIKSRNIKFNLVSFSNEASAWQPDPVEPSEEACKDAIQWTESLVAHGGTATLQALELCFGMKEVEAVYLVTDGKPDTSCKLTLERARELHRDKPVPVHCVSFKCSNESANDFMRKLSAATGGRYHRCHDVDDDVRLALHKLVEGVDGGDGDEFAADQDDPSFPRVEGDDVRAIVCEIERARKMMTSSRHLRHVIDQHEEKMRSKKDEGGGGGDQRPPFLP